MYGSKRNLMLCVNDNTDYEIGTKLYVVKSRERRSFKEACPLCKDEKRVRIREYEFDCPLCVGDRNKTATSLVLNDWYPREFIINECTIKGPEQKNCYSGRARHEDKNLPYIKWYGFSLVRYTSIEKMQFLELKLYNTNPESYDLINTGRNSYVVFDSMPRATSFCRRLHERQQKMLEDFNTEHGTCHKYPFVF